MKYNYISYDDIPLIMKVEDLMPILLIGRNTAYALVRTGQTQSLRVGRQIRISRDALIAFLENNLQADGSVKIPVALRPYMGGMEVMVPKH